MNRSLLFDSPLLLGFDHTRTLLERANRINGEAYPPYNVEACEEGRIRITLAVAGLSAEQLSVSVADNELTIVGTREAETAGESSRDYLHRGIAARGFVRSFVLADGVEVAGAVLEDGLLTIDVLRRLPRPFVKAVPIRTAL